jgi:hypothetical protein
MQDTDACCLPSTARHSAGYATNLHCLKAARAANTHKHRANGTHGPAVSALLPGPRKTLWNPGNTTWYTHIPKRAQHGAHTQATWRTPGRNTNWPAQLLLPPCPLHSCVGSSCSCIAARHYSPCNRPAANPASAARPIPVLHLAEAQLLFQEGKAAGIVARPECLWHW